MVLEAAVRLRKKRDDEVRLDFEEGCFSVLHCTESTFQWFKQIIGDKVGFELRGNNLLLLLRKHVN